MSSLAARGIARPTKVAVGLCLLLAGLPCALANRGATGTASSSASLDFNLNIGKFIFFRVGAGAYPSASGTIDTVNFMAAPTIPPSATVPVTSNNTAVNWNGALPTFAATPTSLPVEVRSNAGQINVRATATTALTSGPNSIPLSQIVLTSSDANLPAPLVPNAGTGPSVNVAGSAFSNLVTLRSASWTFSYNPLTTQPAGVYTGQISFTVSSP